MGKRRSQDPPADARWTATATEPPPVADTKPDPVVEALPGAEQNGHKVGRHNRVLFCWHCDATGMVAPEGATGTIFTTRCSK